MTGIETAIAAVSAWAAANSAVLTAASIAIGIGQQVAGFAAQSEQASATNAYNKKLQENALTARNYRIQQDQSRMIQEADTASGKIME